MGAEKSFYFLFFILLFSKGLKAQLWPPCSACNTVFWDDCTKALGANNNANGVYALSPPLSKPVDLPPFGAYCMFNGGKAWTVIQRRQDGSVDFYRNWENYRNGFGNVNGEYWLGLARLHALTSTRPHELWVEMVTLAGETITVHYDYFSVASESDGFQLTIAGFQGNAGLGDILERNNGKKFSTFDKDNDGHTTMNCAEVWKGGWWYFACGWSNLNGEYRPFYGDAGLWWDVNNKKSLKYVHMAIRPLY